MFILLRLHAFGDKWLYVDTHKKRKQLPINQ